MSNWRYFLQGEHGVVFIHIEVSLFNREVWHEMQDVVDSLVQENEELYACIPHENDKVKRLAYSLGATLIGEDDISSVFCWEK